MTDNRDEQKKEDGEVKAEVIVIDKEKEPGELMVCWDLIMDTVEHCGGMARAITQIRKAKHSRKRDVLRELVRYPSAFLNVVSTFRPVSAVVNAVCSVTMTVVIFTLTLFTSLAGLLLLPFGYRFMSSEIAAGIKKVVDEKKEAVTSADIRAAAESVLRGE